MCDIEETQITAIYVIGPSSTGKTTLCSALARRLALEPSSYITEVARKVMRNRGFTREDVGTLEMQKAIMEAQLAEEEEGRVNAEQRAGPQVLLSDRSAIDAIVYAVLTSRNETEAIQRWRILTSSAKFRVALPRYRQAKVILLTPVPEWLVDDGVRTLDDQDQCLKTFKGVLSELDIKYEEMGGTTKKLSDRVDILLNIIQRPSPRL